MFCTKYLSLSGLCLAAFISGCASEQPESKEISSDATTLADRVVLGGITCESRSEIGSLSDKEFADFYILVRDKIGDEGIQALLDESEVCLDTLNEIDDVATSTQALATGNMIVQKIPWKSVGASDGTIGTVLVDSASTEWMCGPGNKQPDPEPDYILQYFFHPNAYSLRQNLRLGYNTWYEQCITVAFYGGLGSRIWTDNSVRSCLGMSRAHICSQLYFGMNLAPTGFTLVTN